MTPEFPLHVLSEYALLADGERGVLAGPALAPPSRPFPY
jgi:hypothetical protein